MVAFHGSHVVVTGGTGALGTAVVAALRAAGAVCHVTNMVAAELERYPHRDDPGVHITTGARPRRRGGGAPVLCRAAAAVGLGASRRRLCDVAGGGYFGGRFRRPVPDECDVDVPVLGGCDSVRSALRSDPGPGGAKGGRIVNVAARPGLEPRLGSGMVAYATAKAAVAAMTQALAQETANEEIWVNAVAPSVLDTPANRSGDARRRLRQLGGARARSPRSSPSSPRPTTR